MNSIGYYTFSYCLSLTIITIPNSVTSGDFTFKDCSSIININIPNSVNSISNGVYGLCSSFTISKRYKKTIWDNEKCKFY